MSQFLYAIHDLKGACYDRVFSCAHDSDAVRLFDQLVFSPNSPYRGYSEDFVLVVIGNFDPSSGAVLSVPVKQLTSVMERQVFFEAVQRIRQAKVESAVRDHEAEAPTKVESAACDHEATKKVPIINEFGNVSSSDDFEPIGGFLGDF